MKLLINDKKRNIYFRKDNTAYYKSGGSENDVTSMFKKTGGGLKKQFSNLLIEGDEKSANMLGGKTKSRKNKLAVGGAPPIKKVFAFSPISVTYDPNIPDKASPEDLQTSLDELKNTHRVLLLLSILKTLKHSPTPDSGDFDLLDNAYKSFDVTNIKNSIIKNLDSINTELDTTDREKLIESYKKLEDVMGILTSKDAAAAEPGGGVGG